MIDALQELDRPRVRRRIAFVAFCVLLSAYASLFQGVHWNEASRIALTLALIDEGSVHIDRHHGITQDKAYYEGHWYSDKAPGLALLAVPSAAIASWMHARLSEMPMRDRRLSIVTHASTILTSGLATALAALAIYALAVRTGASTAGATFAMASFGLATPAFGWATAFFGHAIAGAFLFAGFALFFRAVDGGGTHLHRGAFTLAGGLLLGLAAVTEYPTAVASALVFLWAGYRLLREGLQTVFAILLPATAGVAAAMGLLLAYNDFAFGSPLTLGYQHTQFAGMRSGFFGLGTPSFGVALDLILGGRGLLAIAPVLVLAPAALVAFQRTSAGRTVAVLCAAIAFYFVLMNAAYFLPAGGHSSGPRHLTPMLAFLCLPLAALWDRYPSWRWVFALLLLASFFLSFSFAIVSMEAPARYDNLLLWLLSEASQGQFHALSNAEANALWLGHKLDFELSSSRVYLRVFGLLALLQAAGVLYVLHLLRSERAAGGDPAPARA